MKTAHDFKTEQSFYGEAMIVADKVRDGFKGFGGEELVYKRTYSEPVGGGRKIKFYDTPSHIETMAKNFVMNYMIEKGWSLSFNITQNSWDKKWSVLFYVTKEE
jgi:hypothetical protein